MSGYSLLLFSYSEEPAEAMASKLYGCCGRDVGYCAFSNNDADSAVSEQIIHTPPEAVVLLLEKDGLQDPFYRKWVKWGIDRVSAKNDFRLFVVLQDMSQQEFNALCDLEGSVTAEDDSYNGIKLLYDLRDTVQINDIQNVSALAEEVSAFHSSIPRIRAKDRYRSFRLGASMFFGGICAFVQILSAVFITLCTAVALILGTGRLVELLAVIPMQYIAVFGALLYAPLLSVILYLFGKGIGASNSIFARDKRLYWMTCICIFLGIATTGMPGAVGAPLEWILLGIAAGTIIDVIRRYGRQARRERFNLRESVATHPGSALPKEVLQVNDNYFSNPLNCPYLSDSKARVFISYTHSSEWAQNVTDELRERLVRLGADCFLDKFDISSGSCWRRQLSLMMAGANVFISVTDDKSIRSDKLWPASEMESALASKHYTGLPELVMLVPPEFSKNISNNNMPVYNAIFKNSDKSVNQIMRIIPVRDNTIQMVASAYKTYSFHTTSVIGSILSLLANFIRGIFNAIGAFSTLFGVAAIVLYVLDRANKISIPAIIGTGALLSTIFLLGCYWAGFSAGYALASRYEGGDRRGKSSANMNLLALIGYACAIPLLFSAVTPIIAGWAIFLCVLGLTSSLSVVSRKQRERTPERSSGIAAQG